jgi:trehalose synthase
MAIRGQGYPRGVLPTVSTPPRHLDEYREVAGSDAVDRLIAAAEPLVGARILNVSSTAFGGGVAELLMAQVALLNDLGVETTWQVMEGSEAFSTVTKYMHTALQGSEVPWDDDFVRIYEEASQENADRLINGFDADIVVVHDLQPAGIVSALDATGDRKGTWIWRCHVDASRPFRPVWDHLSGHVARYDASIFTMKGFVPRGHEGRVFVVPPSIDPLSAKNQWIDPDTVYEILHRFGVQWTRPFVTQVARFDPSKDPLGVIDAYRLAREEVPDLQLVLVGSMAHDDPEEWHYLEVTERHRGGDPNVFILTNVQGVGNLEVNAFQRDARVVLQKSRKEGFGLSVAEAMWKGTPVVGGDVGGIRLQIEDGVSGYLVDSTEETAARMVELLRDDELAEWMGEAGRTRVRERFLTLRELEDLIGVFLEAGPAAAG